MTLSFLVAAILMSVFLTITTTFAVQYTN
jgi:hypothetical protein